MGYALRRMENGTLPLPVLLPGSRSRWLHVISHLDPKYGGLSAAVPELGRTLARRSGCAAEIAAFCEPGEDVHPEGFAAGTVSFWPHSRGTWLHNQQLRRRFEAKVAGFDGVHIHGLWEQSTAEACRAAIAARKPYVLSAHGMLEPWALRNKRLKKMIYAALVERDNVRSAACRIALTEAEAEDYRRFGARGPIAIVPNGVQLPEQVDPRLFLDLHPELAGKRVVLFLGRLHRKKGVDLLLQAWAKLAAQHPDAHLVVAGPDSEGTLETLETFVAEHALQQQVTFAGMLRGELKWSALAAAEAFILPSHSEGLSMSILEAMGMGLPVIVTRQCHMPQVQEFAAGWTIEPEVKEIAGALEELLANARGSNREIGLRGSRLIAERYDWTVIARQTAEVYRWALGGAQPGLRPAHVEVVL